MISDDATHIHPMRFHDGQQLHEEITDSDARLMVFSASDIRLLDTGDEQLRHEMRGVLRRVVLPEFLFSRLVRMGETVLIHLTGMIEYCYRIAIVSCHYALPSCIETEYVNFICIFFKYIHIHSSNDTKLFVCYILSLFYKRCRDE